ncbi:MAG: RNA 2',3'-cyclic phosphodiesterase [Gammaproteobacteria bacterium]|nr:RNA 2',3'-cyclic phosphodiesterase [Gammaproteobacteria bacterium]
MVSNTQPAEHKRIFLALWPDEITRQYLFKTQKELKREPVLQSARAIIPENLHMTLHFIGSISVEVLQALEVSLASVRCKAFELDVNMAGCFARPRVFWLGLENVPPELQELEQQTAACVRQCVEAYQCKPYRPHISLFRKAKNSIECKNWSVVHWPVNSFALVESKTCPEGVRYSVLKEWPLLR